MSNRVQCNCQRCKIRGLMGPAVIVTIGVLFLLQQLRGGFFDFSNTYPVILIVIGLISLASALASSEGHVSARRTSSAGRASTNHFYQPLSGARTVDANGHFPAT